MNKLKIIAFSTLFVFLASFASLLLTDYTDPYHRRSAYDALEKNSVDILMIGNSHSFCTFNPDVLSRVTGLKSFNASMPSQLVDLTWYNLKEQLKSQSPEVIVLEAFTFQGPSPRDIFNDANLDSLGFAPSRFFAIFDLFSNWKDRGELLTKLYRNHINWSDTKILKSNIKRITGMEGNENAYTATKGFYVLEGGMSPEVIGKYRDMKPEEAVFKGKVSDYDIEYFKKILEECKKRNIRVVLTMAPMNKYFIGKLDYKKIYESFSALAKEHGVEYLDYNMLYDEVGLTDADFESVFYNSQHTNVSGAEKVSTHLGKYLMAK